MKLIHDSKPLTSQACSCKKYQNSIYDCSLSYGNRNKSLRLSTREYIRSQDDERLSALAATRSAPTATAQRKNRIKRRSQSRRVELLCTKLPHAAPLHSGSRDKYSVQESKHQTSRIRFGGGMDELGTKIMLVKMVVV